MRARLQILHVVTLCSCNPGFAELLADALLRSDGGWESGRFHQLFSGCFAPCDLLFPREWHDASDAGFASNCYCPRCKIRVIDTAERDVLLMAADWNRNSLEPSTIHFVFIAHANTEADRQRFSNFAARCGSGVTRRLDGDRTPAVPPVAALSRGTRVRACVRAPAEVVYQLPVWQQPFSCVFIIASCLRHGWSELLHCRQCVVWAAMVSATCQIELRSDHAWAGFGIWPSAAAAVAADADSSVMDDQRTRRPVASASDPAGRLVASYVKYELHNSGDGWLTETYLNYSSAILGPRPHTHLRTHARTHRCRSNEQDARYCVRTLLPRRPTVNYWRPLRAEQTTLQETEQKRVRFFFFGEQSGGGGDGLGAKAEPKILLRVDSLY